MRRLFYILSAIALAFPLTLLAWTVPNETLHYSIRWQWGFIDANAGVAKLSTYNIPGTDRFQAVLTGKSVDLLGHYYAAGDTIIGDVLNDSLQKIYTQHLSYNKGDFVIETLTSDSVGSSPDGIVTKHLKNGQVLRTRISNYGGGLTLDLLSVFYYIRQLEYGNMKPGESVTVNVMTHQGVEKLTVNYQGLTTGQELGKSIPVFQISLTFTSKDAAQHSDNLTVQITTDPRRIPVSVVGEMKIGHVDCVYIGGDTLNLPLVETSKKHEIKSEKNICDTICQAPCAAKPKAGSIKEPCDSCAATCSPRSNCMGCSPGATPL